MPPEPRQKPKRPAADALERAALGADPAPGESSKWIPGLTAFTPAGEAARHTLDVRFAAVLRRFEDAAPAAKPERAADASVHAVHQLRVATRRAGAALKAFAPVMDKRRRKRAGSLLKSLRGAAAGARDADVHADYFAGWFPVASATERSAIAFVLGALDHERAVARSALAAARADHPEDACLGTFRKALRGIDGSSAPPLARFATGALAAAADAFQAAARADFSDFQRLHDFRIAGKRLRYALEVFAPCLPAERLDPLYDAVQGVQKRLGEVNDADNLLSRVRSLSDRRAGAELPPPPGVAAGLRELAHALERRRERERSAFLRWWRGDGAAAALGPLGAVVAVPGVREPSTNQNGGLSVGRGAVNVRAGDDTPSDAKGAKRA